MARGQRAHGIRLSDSPTNRDSTAYLHLQDEGAGKNPAHISGNARGCASEPLEAARARLQAVSGVCVNPNAQGLEVQEEPEKSNRLQPNSDEYRRATMRRYKWNTKLEALGLPRIQRGRQDLPDTFEDYLAENGYTGGGREGKNAITDRERLDMRSELNRIIEGIERIKARFC